MSEFVYIRFFSQYSELEQVVFVAKRLQERYRVSRLVRFYFEHTEVLQLWQNKNMIIATKN